MQVNVSCPCSIWGNAVTPPTPDSGDPESVEVGVQVHHGNVRHDHRHPLLQVGGQHRHARRQPVDLQRRTAGDGHVHERNGLRLAAGQLLHARVTIIPNTTYVAGYFAPDGHYADSTDYFYTPPSDRRPHPEQPAAARRLGERRTGRRNLRLGQRPVLLRRHAAPSRRAASRAATTGSTRSSRRPPAARAGHGVSGDRGHGFGDV